MTAPAEGDDADDRSRVTVRPARSVPLFVFGCLAIALLKLWLVGTDEIVARNQPHDDGWFLTSASHWYWSAPPESALLRPPAYPLWIAGVRLTGTPLRLAIEVLLISSAALLGAALMSAGVLAPLCVLLVGVVVFNPVSLQVHDYALADTLYAPLLLLLVGCIVFTLLWVDAGRGVGAGVVTGLVLTALWYTRQETLLLLASLVILAALVIQRRDRAGTRRRLIAAVLVPAAVLAAGILTVRTVNHIRFGVFADSELSAPGLTGAYKALVGIVPAVPRRFIPVSREVRERAYAVSPAFQTLRPHLDGPPARGWQTHTSKVLGIPGEIGAGWMIFALREAAIHAGYREPSDREAFFRGIRTEIERACEDGRLTCRRVLSQVLDPDLDNYAKHLPASLKKLLPWFAAMWNTVGRSGGDRPVDPEIRDLFDRMASRRVALVTGGQGWVHVTGWVVHQGDPIVNVLARDRETRTVVATTEEFLPRPDVRRALGDATPLASGFRISVPVRSRSQRPSLHVVTRTGREFGLPYERRLEMDRPLLQSGADVRQGLRYAIDLVEEVGVPRTLSDKVKTAIGRGHGPFVFMLTAAAIVALLFIALEPRNPRPLLPIAAFILATVSLRVLLYAVLDASAWPSSQARYLWPAVALFPAAPVILIDRAVQAGHAAWRRGEERWNAWP